MIRLNLSQGFAEVSFELNQGGEGTLLCGEVLNTKREDRGIEERDEEGKGREAEVQDS